MSRPETSSATIDRPNLNHIVREHVKGTIFSGFIKPGDKVSEDEIAKTLGISRTPVKLALTELATEGLVELVPRRGAFVRQFSDNDVIEIYEIREAIEALAARLAARHITEEGIQSLKAINSRFEAVAEDFLSATGEKKQRILRDMKAADLDFHRELLYATGNKHLIDFMGIQVIEFHSFLYGYPRNPEVEMPITRDQHSEIIKALEERDAEKAEKIIREHISKARLQIQRSISHG
ncbi:MAG: GntR family transcriptional regulator [Spirochaetales bacterium]|nr:GntR family transcriptional regulator [Spirochaetales bacterium]